MGPPETAMEGHTCISPEGMERGSCWNRNGDSRIGFVSEARMAEQVA